MMKNKIIPMITLRGKIIFPAAVIHFDVTRDKSINAIEQSMKEEQYIFLSNQMDSTIEEPSIDELYSVGTIARIKQLMKLPNGVVRVLVEGLYRGRMIETIQDKPFFIVDTEVCHNGEENNLLKAEIEAMARVIKECVKLFVAENPKVNRATIKQLLEIDSLELLIDEVATHLPLMFQQKQMLLEELDLHTRAEKLLVMLKEEIEIYQIRRELQVKIKEKVDKNQRDYLLREQLKVIREELGEGALAEADEYLEKTKKLNAPDEVKEKLEKEIERFKNTGGSSAESYVSRNYIDTLLEMPWEEVSKDNMDIKNAWNVLEADHYGLHKVKERIIEYLAVRALTQKGEAPILCLVGPPGTGKTSIGKSIARAVEKKYVRLSLGGIRDEAEIRGHRKTYIGAMPGRIANGIKQAGVKNPLMLLDEIDKVSKDYKGDTAAALLEVLDGEQNFNFRDHYLETALDLSEVLFIATANDINGIPRPLLDRMEIIQISSYTENEKFHIAKKYLVPKQKEKNGLSKEQLTFSDKALTRIISGYTREAGVRSLERKIGEVCRKAARKIMEEGKTQVKLTDTNVAKYLGTEMFSLEDEDLKAQVGIVRGLAWTSIGGDTLSIEVNIMPGKGRLELTGRLGDVMKESARIGISYIRSVSDMYQIDNSFFEKNDIHIHIPEGAVPKDGPSAGITMAAAILSAITKKPVRGDIAMTGELTLRGNVLPIGGLKEKILAAKVIGVKEVLLPAKNEKNIKDVDKEILTGMKLTYVSNMEEVMEHALIKEK